MESDVKITGSSYKNLLENVTNYRAENHISLGDVEGDVTNYICGNWPHFCHGVDMVVVTSVTSPTGRSELMNDISTWARNILHSNERTQLVSDDLAEQRAKICRQCPNNGHPMFDFIFDHNLKQKGYFDSVEKRNNLAFTLEILSEQIMYQFLKDLKDKYPDYKKITFAGGIFANVKLNQYINIYICIYRYTHTHT